MRGPALMFALLLAPAGAAAQIQLPPAKDAVQILPGSTDIDGTRLSAGVWDVTMTMQRAGQSIALGTMRYELTASSGGEPQWLLVMTTTTALGVATDSSVATRVGLVPVRHRSHAVPRKLFLDYDGTAVTGQYVPASGAARDIARTTAVPTFDAAMLDLVLGALPLAPDYRARIPIYIEEQDGLAWVDVHVTGERTVGDVAGWVVRATNPRYTVDFVIGKRDRRFLGGRVEYPNGVVMELTRS